MNDYVAILHDGFAREYLVRRTVETSDSCDWCGGTRKSGKLFEYGIEPESIGGRVHWIKGLFCEIECMRSYHG